MNRRRFLQTGAAASLALQGFPAILGDTPQRFRTALIGAGWWGMNIGHVAMQSGASKIVALCDVDENQLRPAVENVERLSGDRPRVYKDFRDLLAQEKPDIAIVATPDHWHPLIAIAAVKAGAHVYVEKPVSHTILEGKAMVRAARESDRVMQVDLWRRVSPDHVAGMEFLKSGKAGKIGMVRAFVHYPGGPGEPTPDSDPPPGLDWDLWCGPAPYRNFNRAIHPKGFRQFLEYANGQLGDWGVHWMDQILWWTEEKYPRKVYSTGGRWIKRDSTNAPDTQIVAFEFETFTAHWEHRLYAGNRAEKAYVGCYFYGTEGTFHMGWTDGWTFYPDTDNKPLVHMDAHLDEPDDQNIALLWANFIDAIRSRQRPVRDIEIGHRSTNMSLLGMLSLKLGRSIEWDGEKEEVVGDPEANRLLRREYRSPWKYPEV
jgi:predicted dehydrogenase